MGRMGSDIWEKWVGGKIPRHKAVVQETSRTHRALLVGVERHALGIETLLESDEARLRVVLLHLAARYGDAVRGERRRRLLLLAREARRTLSSLRTLVRRVEKRSVRTNLHAACPSDPPRNAQILAQERLSSGAWTPAKLETVDKYTR